MIFVAIRQMDISVILTPLSGKLTPPLLPAFKER